MEAVARGGLVTVLAGLLVVQEYEEKGVIVYRYL